MQSFAEHGVHAYRNISTTEDIHFLHSVMPLHCYFSKCRSNVTLSVEHCTLWAKRYKSNFPGSGLVAQRRTNAGRLNFVRLRLIFWVLRMELPSYQPS